MLSFLPSTKKNINLWQDVNRLLFYLPVDTIPGLDKPLKCQMMVGTGWPVARQENRADRPSRTVIRIFSGEWEMIRGGTRI
jgi:hypothetical protein